MEKYYTPKIEELYVGFECEHTSNMTAFKIDDTDRIYKENLNQADLCNYLNWEIEEGGLEKFIRVKYLDREDIESLGFILKGKSIDLWFQREGIYLRYDGHHLKNIMLQYGTHDQRLRITFLYTSGEEQIHFEGKIKNKSELKKLVKQLEIEQDGRSSFY